MTSADPPRLAAIAHGRSGDKGDHANVAVIAYAPPGYAWLREHLTADAVRRYFGRLGPSRVPPDWAHHRRFGRSPFHSFRRLLQERRRAGFVDVS